MKRITAVIAALLLGVVVAPTSLAATTVQGGPLTGLSPDSVTQVHLAFSGFPTTHGLYVEEAVQAAAGARPTTAGPALWLSAIPADLAQGATQIAGDVVLKVDNGHSWGADCVHQQCGIFIRLDHTAPNDTSEDKFLPLTFTGGAVTSTTSSNAPADTWIVSINGKVVTPNVPITVQYRSLVKFTVNTSSGVTTTLRSFNPNICPAYPHRIVILKGTGACDIAVVSEGDATHPAMTQHFPLILTPAVPRPDYKNYLLKVSRTAMLLKATGFGDTITYTSSSPSCSINGNAITGVQPGKCVITATAPAGENYLAMSKTFKIKVINK
jgi:hypothetical protein